MLGTTTISTNRRNRASQVSCSWFYGTVSDLVDIASDTSEQKNIATLATLLNSADVDSCSAAEQSILRTHKVSLQGIVEDHEDYLSTGTSDIRTSYTTSGKPNPPPPPLHIII